MSCRLFLIVTLSLFGAGTLILPPTASAETPLTRATVQALRNQVQLIFKNRSTRAAQNADTMTPGDSLATARKAFAELRFNDNSLARIGERALFQFVPSTRNFYLGNGTALLLIPPGQGRTNVRTPNAAAGIRGSALFIRYNEDTNTTIVGALTNSRIEVSNSETPQAQTLKAGQMAVVVQNQIVQVYNFDLNTFYQTSELVKDLDLPLRNAAPSTDPGIAAVQAETAQAVREQLPMTGQVSENPAFVTLSPAPALQTAVTPSSANQVTLTPSGLDLSTARQTLVANPSAQVFTAPVAGVQPSVITPQAQLSVSNPTPVSAATPQVQPITLPQISNPPVVINGSVPFSAVTTPSSVPSNLPAPSASAAPPPPVLVPPIPALTSPAQTVQPPALGTIPPATLPSTVVPPPNTSPAPPIPVQPSPPVPVVSIPQPSPAPAPPVQPSLPVPVVPTLQPRPAPAPTVPVQPQPPVAVPVVSTPQPSAAPAPPVQPSLPVPVVVSTPQPRPAPIPIAPAPIATPAPTPIVQPAPTPISPVADTPVIQTPIVTPPTLVTPTPTTVQVQTGTPGTSVQVQTGVAGGAARP